MLTLPALVLVALGSLTPAAPLPAPDEDAARLPAAENPRASGDRLGLGLDLLSDRLDGIDETASRTELTLTGPDGRAIRTVRPGDPDLTNRKFDQELELRGVGVQLPIALPVLRLGGGVSVAPSLVVELAAVEAELTYDGRTEEDADVALDGDGLQIGVGLEWVATACRRCRWFWGGGYRYRLLPDLDVERSPALDAGELEILRDEVELGAESHRLTGRIGYPLRGGRLAPYVGFRYRTAEIELTDEITLTAGDLGEETALRTETTLDADGLAGVVGLDARIGERYAARFEAAIGDDGASGLVKVVGFLGGAGAPELSKGVPELLENGPRVKRSRRSVEVDGLVAAGWPIVAGFVLPEDGTLQLTVTAPDQEPMTYRIPADAGERRSEVRNLPEGWGRELEVGRFVARAVSTAGEPIPFELVVLAAGPGAVASEPLGPITAGKRGSRPDWQLEYRYQLTRAFDRGVDEIWRWPPVPDDPNEEVFSVRMRRSVIERTNCLQNRQWCDGWWGVPGDGGIFFIQASFWNGFDTERGDGWVAAISVPPLEFVP